MHPHSTFCPATNDPDATCVCQPGAVGEFPLEEAPIVSLAEHRQRRAEAAQDHCECCGRDVWGLLEWDFDEDCVSVVDDLSRPILVLTDPDAHEAIQMSPEDALKLAQKLLAAVKTHAGIDSDGGPQTV